MSLTDVFIRRPVLAVVVNLFLLLLGAIAFVQLEEREYPKVEDTSLTVATYYPGADAEQVLSYVTSPLQEVFASVEGVDYLSSSSSDGISLITVHLEPGYDANAAMAEMTSVIAPVKNEFPAEVEYPEITKDTASIGAGMFLQAFSDTYDLQQLTDYLERVINPEIMTLPGVGSVSTYGAREYAMRLWLDPVQMAAFDISVREFHDAITQSSFQTPAGELESGLVVTKVKANTELNAVEEFENIVIRQDGNGRVQVKDVARVVLGAADTSSSVFFKGERGLSLGVSASPGVSPLALSRQVRAKLEELESRLPEGVEVGVSFDAAESIESSMTEVNKTILEASLIVLMVVFLFLGDIRSVIIPVVAIPLSLLGNIFIMFVLGYSINLFTLLSMVLAIGLVVDDAIVVVENIHRHIDEGMKPFDAALKGAREIAMPVVSMTLTLAAVYAPMGFLQGMSGEIIREFVFTLTGAVILSGLVALTLSPMMCSRLLKAGNASRFSRWLDDRFNRLQQGFKTRLAGAMNQRPVVVVMLVVMLGTIPPLVLLSKSELVPIEDIGWLNAMFHVPATASLEYMERESDALEDIMFGMPEYGGYSFRYVNVFNDRSSMIAFRAVPWDERERTANEIFPEFSAKLSEVPGLLITPFIVNRVPGSMGGLPVQLVIKTTQDYAPLSQVADNLLAEALGSGLFVVGLSDLRFDKPELEIVIDRYKAAQLGVSIADIGTALTTLLGENEIGRFTLYGENYKIIPQAMDATRTSSDWLNHYHVRTGSGAQVPLGTVIETRLVSKPSFLNQFQQQNAATLSFLQAPNVSMGEAVDLLDRKAAELLPEGYYIEYEGDSRKFKEEGAALYVVFGLALLSIYLVLAAQFESFRDPLVILTSVPMSVCGALVFLVLGFATMNLYTQVALITLIGLITKHGILIVEFANKLQATGMSRSEAAVEAAAVRLRPILMTTAAMVLGVVPLLLATGAGAISRFQIGLVISTGVLVGTICSLFVVPVMYSYLAREHRSPTTDGGQIPATA
ncbi:MAG: multidrug efflux protein [Porticoccaceae bacterium]|nr:multidrug efflux protein [Porticoccaceae bacterium]